jgi:hypothetical protein
VVVNEKSNGFQTEHELSARNACAGGGHRRRARSSGYSTGEEDVDQEHDQREAWWRAGERLQEAPEAGRGDADLVSSRPSDRLDSRFFGEYRLKDPQTGCCVEVFGMSQESTGKRLLSHRFDGGAFTEDEDSRFDTLSEHATYLLLQRTDRMPKPATHIIMLYPSQNSDLLYRASDGMNLACRMGATVISGVDPNPAKKEHRNFLDENYALMYLRRLADLDQNHIDPKDERTRLMPGESLQFASSIDEVYGESALVSRAN